MLGQFGASPLVEPPHARNPFMPPDAFVTLAFRRTSAPAWWAEAASCAPPIAPAVPALSMETQPDAKEERVMLLEAWRAFEAGAADGDAARVEKKMPRRVKRKRAIFADDGAPAGQEEYYDYIFPEEQGAAPNLKILEAAYAWKKRRTE